MGGIKAGSLKRNKSEWERTQGPGSYLALCQALTALDVFRRGSWTQHLDHVYLLTPFSSANSSGSILGGDRLFFILFFLSYTLLQHSPHPPPPRFCSCLKAAASLSSQLYGEGTSLLAGMDILTGDILWPLAYGNSVKAQPGLIVTSAVLGEVFGEVQA